MKWLLAFVALFVVFPRKSKSIGGGFVPKPIGGALLLNGIWGLGAAGLMKLHRQG